ncbi:2Fe-2S iron-sulfur cluster-binding protein, partial [Streptomyces sp. CNQ085]|uniref:2Fe-2S iron-sulfur cluster-binding protein n=1 Tax=Streptomyces sp. CNQ085 TaxID=2886944 RepID=UPI001F510159
MSNDQQGPFRQDDGRPVPPPAPEGGWGGEHDGDSTAFIQLPENLPGPYHYGYADGPGGTPEPLAAPGTGHGWEPPAIDPGAPPPPRSRLPVTPEAANDPAAPVQWTMPFAGSQAESAEPVGPAPSEPARPEREQGPPPGAAAAMGQGAAAALAGSHEARVRQQRRPRDGEDREAPAPAEGSGGDWNAVPAPGATGQWSIPFAAADSPDDSGEYPAAAVAGGVPEPPPVREPRGADDREPAEVPGAEAAEATEPVEPVEPGVDPVESAAEGAPEAGGEPDTPDAWGQDAGEPPADPSAPRAAEVDSEHPHVSYVLRVNGTERPVADAWIGESLLYVLRERLGLAGAKDGCSQGECGACSVQVDGRLVASCLVPAATTAGSEIRTVEGLARNGTPCDVQRALAACGAVQCGFCVPGMAMTLHDLLEGNHDPTELETRQAVSGNLCRCSGYRGVLDAVRTVVAEREA